MSRLRTYRTNRIFSILHGCSYSSFGTHDDVFAAFEVRQSGEREPEAGEVASDQSRQRLAAICCAIHSLTAPTSRNLVCLLRPPTLPTLNSGHIVEDSRPCASTVRTVPQQPRHYGSPYLIVAIEKRRFDCCAHDNIGHVIS